MSKINIANGIIQWNGKGEKQTVLESAGDWHHEVAVLF